MAAKKTMSALEELEALRAKVAAQKAAQRKLRDDESEATRAVQAADAALVEAIQRLGAAGEAKAVEVLRQAEQRAREPWPQRAVAAQQRVKAAEDEVERFVRRRLGDLTAELAQDELKLRAVIRDALEVVEAAITELTQLDGHRNRLVMTATGQQAPSSVGALEELHRQVRQALRTAAPGARSADPPTEVIAA